MNKLMARIVAVVLAVMMLGTVSFAANPTLNAANNEIPDGIGETSEFSEVWTVKATTDKNVIVAMYQGTVAPGPIAIDATKLAGCKSITVEYSGKNGNGINEVTVDVNAKTENVVVDAVNNTITIDGVKYTDVLEAKTTFDLKGKTVKELGYKLTATGTYKKNGETVTATGAENLVKYTGTISGTGSVYFDVVVLGIPETATVTAVPYILYY